MSDLCVADASALYEMCRIVGPTNHVALLTALSSAVDNDVLAFPREVVDDLQMIGLDEPIWAWASGIKSQIGRYDPDISHMRPLMGHVRTAGFPNGIDSLDGKENCLARVGCLCLELDAQTTSFVLATEDTGELPLRPTMEQIAKEAGWTTVDATRALAHLGLGHLTP